MTNDAYVIVGALLVIVWALYQIRDSIDKLTDWLREGKE